MNIENMEKGLGLIEEGYRLLAKGPSKFYTEHLLECRQALFDRCCPFSVGDEVLIRNAPDIDEDSGWQNSEHFLVEGCKAKVVEVGFREGRFYADIEPHNQTYKSLDGAYRQVHAQSSFRFSTDDLSLNQRKEK